MGAPVIRVFRFCAPRGRRKSAYPAASNRHGARRSGDFSRRLRVQVRALSTLSAPCIAAPGRMLPQRSVSSASITPTAHAQTICAAVSPAPAPPRRFSACTSPNASAESHTGTPRPPRHKRAEQEPPEENLLQHPCAEHGRGGNRRLRPRYAASPPQQVARVDGRERRVPEHPPCGNPRAAKPQCPPQAALAAPAEQRGDEERGEQRITAVRRAQPLAQPVAEPHRKHIRRDAYKRKAQRIPPVDPRQHQPITHGASLSRTRRPAR